MNSSDQMVDSAERAGDILASWKRRDLCDLQAELDRTRRAFSAMTVSSVEEQERMDLLDGIAGRIQQDLRDQGVLGDSAGTCFRLLEHLATSGKYSAIRFETLSASRY